MVYARPWCFVQIITACLLLANASGTSTAGTSTSGSKTTAEPFPTVASSISRNDSQYPSPRCCQGKRCLSLQRTSKHVFVASLRSPGYLHMLRELHCSLQKSNPGVPLIVMGAQGDLDGPTISQIKALNNTSYQLVPDLGYDNNMSRRFSLNWIKLRAWEMEDYDAIIMLDVDMVVKGKVTQLFSLPTDFAWAPLQGPGWHHNAGGLVLLRPCKAVFDHMLQLLTGHEELRFPEHFAEQSFLRWYFGTAATHLPQAYNTNFDFVTVSQTGALRSIGSEQRPLVIHFANVKPFTPTKGTREWPFLCHAPTHPHHHRYQGHPVTLYAKCANVNGVVMGSGQYATFGPGDNGNATVISGLRLQEYRMYKAVNMIVVHRSYSDMEVQLFDNAECLGEPFYRSSHHRVCLDQSVNQAACVKVLKQGKGSKDWVQSQGTVGSVVVAVTGK